MDFFLSVIELSCLFIIGKVILIYCGEKKALFEMLHKKIIQSTNRTGELSLVSFPTSLCFLF